MEKLEKKIKNISQLQSRVKAPSDPENVLGTLGLNKKKEKIEILGKKLENNNKKNNKKILVNS